MDRRTGNEMTVNVKSIERLTKGLEFTAWEPTTLDNWSAGAIVLEDVARARMAAVVANNGTQEAFGARTGQHKSAISAQLSGERRISPKSCAVLGLIKVEAYRSVQPGGSLYTRGEVAGALAALVRRRTKLSGAQTRVAKGIGIPQGQLCDELLGKVPIGPKTRALLGIERIPAYLVTYPPILEESET